MARNSFIRSVKNTEPYAQHSAGGIFLFSFLPGVGKPACDAFFAGFLAGYLFYDITHYAIHHFNLRSKFWMDLKHHHMIHHYKDPDNGYGVSSKFWDLIFRTTFKKNY